MLNRKKWKRVLEKEEKKSALVAWIEKELANINFDLSDTSCRFYIRNNIEQRGDSIIIELYIEPLGGTFESIIFKPKIFILSHNFTNRPRIYNDRRLFHPNINMYTCELVFPQLVKQWNPTQEFNSVLQYLKYTIIEPNLKFVPNTELNKKAAWSYRFNKKNYRNLIIENSPLYLENMIGHEFDLEFENRMEIQENLERIHEFQEDDFWSIEAITVRQGTDLRNEEIYDDEDSILLLAKQIKSLDMNEDRQSQVAEFE